jgi:hypothetical protein
MTVRAAAAMASRREVPFGSELMSLAA